MTVDMYGNMFLSSATGKKEMNTILRIIKEVEEESAVKSTQWNEEQIKAYLRKFNSISPIALKKNVSLLKKFCNFVQDKEHASKVNISVSYEVLKQCADVVKLLSVTLSKEQFKEIRRKLAIIQDGETIDYRNIVIFDLAWEGLTEDEISKLKEVDVEFIKNRNEEERILLHCSTEKLVRIMDIDTISDIKKCINTTSVTKRTKDGRLKTTSYKESKYLIKPGKSGTYTPKTYLDKPDTALRAALRKQNIKCEGIDNSILSVEDIRRSNIVFKLADPNEKYYDIKTLLGLYNLKNETVFRWYKDISILKYNY